MIRSYTQKTLKAINIPLKLTNRFRKVAGNKTNIQKVAFLCTNKSLYKKDILKILFTIAIIILGNKFNQGDERSIH